MIVPSIDLLGGQTVQLVGGRDKALDAGDPRPFARRFRLAGEIAVIDLDAALGQGSNAELIETLLTIADCRVGGGIRTAEAALSWLDRGAAKVILGTRAVPEILQKLPSERVIAALDAVDGEVVVEGWRERTGRCIEERMAELNPYVGGFLVTFVEKEGRLGGTHLDRVPSLVEAARGRSLTVAGGVTTASDILALDRSGADAQVGMALYTGRLSLADAILAPLDERAKSAGWPTVVTDSADRLLWIGCSTKEDLVRCIEDGRANITPDPPLLSRVDLFPKLGFVRLQVEAAPSAQTADHAGQMLSDRGLLRLVRRLSERSFAAPEGSYTARLLGDPGLLLAKICEEAAELASAEGSAEVAAEAADLFYFACVKLAKHGVPIQAVERVLDLRERKISRRPGEAKR